jgi:hypothetical protein
MIFAVHACACCACQMASTASSVASSSVTVSGEEEVAPSSMAVAPLASMGSIRSDRQASDSVAAARRKLSASTRRVRSIETGRKPIASSISMNGTTASSSSRTRSFGAGVAPPVASRISISRFNGRLVRRLNSSNVSSLSVANRS